jgi:hypothetical protein
VGFTAGLSALSALAPNNWLGLLMIAAAALALLAVAVALTRAREQERRAAPAMSRSAAERPTEIRNSAPARETPLFHPLFYGMPLLVVTVALVGTLGWWSLIVVIPLNLAVGYVFYWPGLTTKAR